MLRIPLLGMLIIWFKVNARLNNNESNNNNNSNDSAHDVHNMWPRRSEGAAWQKGAHTRIEIGFGTSRDI